MNTTLKLRLLGSPRVEKGETAVTGFVSNKAQALLYYLAVTGEPHTRAKLVGLFWGDSPQKKARTSLRTALYNLQQLVAPHITATRKTVAFDQEQPYWIDVVTFETAITTFRKSDTPTAQDYARLGTAVGHYRGDLLEGFYIDDAPEFEEWLLLQRERLRHMALEALEQLAIHYTNQGDYPNAIRYTQRLLALEPWLESSHRRLMRLLARQGQYNAALKQYETCRSALATELGVAPMPETAALYERIRQLRRRPPRLHLPPAPGPLVGRQEELAALQRLLHNPDCRLVTLFGPGGTGKTRLALEAVAALPPLFLDGIHYIPLAAVTTPDSLVNAIASTLEIAFSGNLPPPQQLLEQLRYREALLLLDSFEHLMDGVDLIADLLQQAPDVKLVVTSREKLRLREEWVFALEGLPYPPAAAGKARPPSQYEAVQLFAQNARRAHRQFNLQKEEEAVARICRLLEGSPLGIELAAALVPAVSCTHIATEIEHNLDVLAAGWRNVPDRHRTLRAVFNHSWRLLSPVEQSVFQKLSVFRGGFTLAAAQAVAGATPSLLQTLVAKSLVRRVETAAETRYDVHEILHQYTTEALANVPTTYTETHARHATYYTTMMAQKEATFATETAAFMQQELGNVRSAWEWAVTQADFAAIGRSMYALHQFYEARSWYQEGSELFARAVTALQPYLETAAAGQTTTWGRLLSHHAAFLLRLGHIAQGLQAAQQSAAILRIQGDRRSLLFTLNVLGVLYIYSGDLQTAEATLQECAALCRQEGERLQLLKLLANLGSVYKRLGQYGQGKQALQEGLTIAREVGDKRGMTHFLNNLGAIHLILGELSAAKDRFQECLPLCDETGHKYVKMVALHNLGEIYAKEGAYSQAQAVCEESVALARDAGDRVNLPPALKWLGVAQYRLGDQETGWGHLREGLQVAMETEAVPAVLNVLDGVATLLVADSRRQEAAALLAFLISHPSAEQQYVDNARRLLDEMEMVLTEEMKEKAGQRPLPEVVAALLAGNGALA